MLSSGPRLRLFLLSAAAFQLAAGPSRAQTEPGDPWEHFNRKMYGVEESIDRHLFGPAARGFGKTPGFFRTRLVNISHNLGEPTVMANDVLQGHVGAAASTLGRFAINSIFGVAGMFDVATRGRIPHHDNSFGTTLGRWGVKSGPYLFLPLVGPSNVRDSFGSLVNIFINPLYYVSYRGDVGVGITSTLVNGLDTRLKAQDQLEAVRRTSTDPYATIRSFFMQNRASEIGGQSLDMNALPDFDTGEPAPAPPAGSAQPIPGEPPVSTPQSTGAAPPLAGAAGALPKPETIPAPEGPPPAPPAPEAAPAPAPPPAGSTSPQPPAP